MIQKYFQLFQEQHGERYVRSLDSLYGEPDLVIEFGERGGGYALTCFRDPGMSYCALKEDQGEPWLQDFRGHDVHGPEAIRAFEEMTGFSLSVQLSDL